MNPTGRLAVPHLISHLLMIQHRFTTQQQRESSFSLWVPSLLRPCFWSQSAEWTAAIELSFAHTLIVSTCFIRLRLAAVACLMWCIWNASASRLAQGCGVKGKVWSRVKTGPRASSHHLIQFLIEKSCGFLYRTPAPLPPGLCDGVRPLTVSGVLQMENKELLK